MVRSLWDSLHVLSNQQFVINYEFIFREILSNVWHFQEARCEVIVKCTNCNLLEHEWIRTEIRTLEAQIDEKNKNIEAAQNVTGSYEKKRV